MDRRERFRGCLLGGAAGDALGAPVEFMSRPQILARFGPSGIRDFHPAYGRRGAITDDTQMTLFTVEGLIRAANRQNARGICHPPTIVRYAYDRWLATQGEKPGHPHALNTDYVGWLFAIQNFTPAARLGIPASPPSGSLTCRRKTIARGVEGSCG